jgi:hypothetical protein
LVILGTGAAEVSVDEREACISSGDSSASIGLVLGEEEIAGLRPRSIGSYIRCRGRDRGFSFGVKVADVCCRLHGTPLGPILDLLRDTFETTRERSVVFADTVQLLKDLL